MLARSKAATAALLLLSVACSKAILAPAASAGTDQTINAGTLVKLDGHASTDPQGRALAFDWSFSERPLGSATTLADSTTPTPSFLADLAGVYRVQLVVSNSVLVSPPATVTITASSCGRNPPVVLSIAPGEAGAGSPVVGAVVQFTASVSDADNTPACGNLNRTFSYAWQITALPAGSAARLNGPVSANPSIATDVAGDYTVQLLVTDNVGVSSAPATSTIHVAACGEQALRWPAASAVTMSKQDPEAPADDTQVHAGARLTFAGHAIDPNSCGAQATVAYLWTLSAAPQASRAVLVPQPDGTASLTLDAQGSYAVAVTATDSLGNSSPVQVLTVATSECGRKPISIAVTPAGTSFGAPATLFPQESLALGIAGDAASSGDNQNDFNVAGYCPPRFAVSFGYGWTLTAGPAGADAALGAIAGPASAFTAGTPGSYSVLLRATASNGAAATATAYVKVRACDRAPLGWPAQNAVMVAASDPDPTDPAADPAVHPGALVKLRPALIDSNSCGSAVPVTVSYRWSLFATPAGSKAALANPAATVAAFVPDVAGPYQLSVSAEDSLGSVSPLQFVTVTTSSCGQSPVSVAATPANTTLAAPFAANAQQLISLGLGGGAARSGDNQNDFSKPDYCPARFANTFSYRWQIINQPAAGAGSLTNLAGASTGFSAATPGSYSVEVVATASNGRVSNPSDVFLQVGNCGASAPILQSVGSSTSRAQLGQPVTLTAQGVSPDAQSGCSTIPTLSYQWTLVAVPAGSAVSTASATSASTFSFTPDVAGTFAFSLVAKDSNGHLSQPLTVTVPAGSCGPSVPSTSLITSSGGAVAGQPLTLTAPAGIGAAQSCTAGSVYTFGWAVTTRPSSSTSALSASAGASASFTPDVPGIYIFQLTVTDAAGFSTQVSQPITVFGALIFGAAALPDGYLGTPYTAQVQASGGKAPLSIAVAPGSSLPSGITLSQAGGLAGTPVQAGSVNFSLQATDATGATATQPFTLYTWPALAITSNTLPSGFAAAAYSQQLGATGGKPPYSFTSGALPSGLTLTSGGLLAGTPTAPGSGAVTLQVKDQNGAVATASITLTISPALSVDASARPPDGYLLNAYSFSLPAIGGLAPYTFTSVAGSTLPGGLSLTANKIVGTPTTTGNFSFTVQVTDSAFGTATGTFSMSVFGAPGISTSTLADAYVGTAYSLTLTATGGHPPLTFAIASGNTLPAGLQFSSAGAFSGTPSTTGNFPLTVIVIDASGTHGQSQFLLHAFAPLAIGNPGFADAYPGVSYGPIALQANGGKPPYTWFLQSGALPASIVLDAIAQTLTSNSNQVQGQSLGGYNFTLGLRDANNVTVTAQQSIGVVQQPAITHAQFVDAYVGDAYLDQLTASGGKQPLSWTLNGSGTPPAWLAIGSGGAASGAVATPGSYSASITVRDANNIAATLLIPLQVYAQLVLTTPATLPVATESFAYSQSLATAGGKGPISWAVTAGALPPGLSLDGSGVLSGIPSGPKQYSFTVRATDANGKTSSVLFTLTVAPGPANISNAGTVSRNGTVDVDFTANRKNVYIAWAESTQFGGPHIFLASSTDDGAHFTSPIDAGGSTSANGWPAGAYLRVRPADGAIAIFDDWWGEYDYQGGTYCNPSRVRVSTDSGSTWSYANIGGYGFVVGRNIFAGPAGKYVHLLNYCGGAFTTAALTYQVSTTLGLSFSAPVQLAAAGGFGRGQDSVFESDDGTIYAAWVEATSSNHADVMLVRSIDHGATFSAPTSGSSLSIAVQAGPSSPVIRASGAQVEVFFNAGGNVYSAASANDGQTFAAAVQVAPNFQGGDRQVAANTLVAVGPTPSRGESGEVSCTVSHDLGASWSAPHYLTSDGATKSIHSHPDLSFAVANGATYVAWAAGSGVSDIYFRKYATECQ